MTTDATRCAQCGGEFSRVREWLDGKAYHPSCIVASYPSHTPEDYSRLSDEFARLRAERDDLLKANALLHSLLTTARGERDALRAANQNLRDLIAQAVDDMSPSGYGPGGLSVCQQTKEELVAALMPTDEQSDAVEQTVAEAKEG